MAKYSKQDLKAMMREKLSAKSTKIDSPLASYDSKGQLSCRICLTPQKESAWTTHLLSQQHKESIEKLKRKTKKEDDVVHTTKAVKRVFEKVAVEPISEVVNLNEKTNEVIEPKGDEKLPTPPTTGLPAGFFDDPIRDARERSVVYKDPMEEEWSKFQKIMSGEASKADVIVQDELEETQKDVTVEEIDRQISSWHKIDQLQKKAENLRSHLKPSNNKHKNEPAKIEQEHDDNEDEDFDALLDWRSKKVKK